MWKLFLLIPFILIISGCNKTPGDSVKIVSGNVSSTALFMVNGHEVNDATLDLGEYILNTQPLTLTVRVYNDTQYPFTDIDLVVSTANPEFPPTINYAPDEEGEIAFPGNEGTCGRSLASKASCLIMLTWSPRDERPYLERLTLTFKDYIHDRATFADLKLLAGTPAALTFTNDQTQYTFGNLVGTAQTPVVERADAETYSQVLEVKNVGGLFARNLTVTSVEACVSTETSLCPDGMSGAYSVVSSCPPRLAPQETCRVTVTYRAKNQDPDSGPVPTDIQEINYRDTVTFGYLKDPNDGTGALNGYFRSVSTNIEARMRVSLTALSFDTSIISGNRDVRTFRVNNVGYREGEIKSFTFKDNMDVIVAQCSADATSDILQCVDNSGNPTLLSNFPYFLRDRNKCMAAPPLNGTLIEVNAGCIFDLNFQPSTAYLSDREFNDWKIEVTYDSRWKGGPKLLTQKILDVDAKSLAAGRIELSMVNLWGATKTITGVNPAYVDLGRLALQSPGFFKRKPLIVSLKNVGSVPVTNTSFRDLRGTVIPIGGTPVNLGAKSPYYFVKAFANESSCAYIAPGDSCSITMEFAPIGLDTAAEEDANMFDGTTLDGTKIKGLVMNYTSGANYSDTNFTDVPDILTNTHNSQFHAQLIRKGLLMELADISRNLPQTGTEATTGDTTISYLFLQNIGTGDVPYIRFTNPPDLNYNLNQLTILPTANPASLGANYDCLAITDTDLSNTVPTSATPASRVGHFSSLPKDEICVFTIQRRTPSTRKAWNTSCSNSFTGLTNLGEGTRFFSREAEASGGANLWRYCESGATTADLMNININYYDGDATDPSLPVGSTYGRRLTLAPFSMRFIQYVVPTITPYNFTPALTATMYRPSFQYPALSPTQPAGTAPERWFYGPTDLFYYLENDPNQTSPFIQAQVSRHFVPNLVHFGESANFDHVLFLGSFPEGSAPISITPGLLATGISRYPRLTELTVTPDPAFTQTLFPTIPQSLVPGASLGNFSFSFDPAVPGEHKMEIRFKYQSGQHTQPLIYLGSTLPQDYGSNSKMIREGSLLVIAHVQPTGTHAKLRMDVQDYEVTQNPGYTPTESPLTPYNSTLSWNEEVPTSTLIFDTIKLTAPATTQDVYAKKRIIFSNPTSYPVKNLQILYRATTISNAIKTLPTTYKIVTGGTTCTPGITLNPGASCAVTITYQPGSTDIADNFIMSMVYDMGTNQPVIENVGIGLMPRSPGLLVALNKSTETINYKVASNSSTVTRFSYPLNFGSLTLNTVPKLMPFSNPTGTYQKLQFVNNQPTKASLLLSYQRYVTEHSLRGYSPSTPAPTTLEPQSGEYRDISGDLFAPIYRKNYGNGTEKLLIEASKGCFYGDDEFNAAIPSHQKGFNATTVTPCYVSVRFSANFDWLLTTIAASNGDHMRETAAELWYYSVYRSSTASVWVHVRGTINPDTSASTGDYSDVESYDTRALSFRVPDVAPTTVAVGDVVGIRVLMSTSASALNSPYSTTLTSYFDIKPYVSGAENYAEFLSGLANGQFFYFRIVAIRKDNRFVDTTPKKFLGLGAGEYLSVVSNSTIPLKVLVPPLNHAYFHSQKMVVDKNLHDGVTYASYSAAAAKCTNRTKMLIKDPGTINYTYQLINIAAWENLLANPWATAYANMTQISHWVSNPQVSVDSVASGLPGFLPGQASQVLSSSGVFYLRNSSNYSSLVNQAVGGVPGTSYSNYMSYVYGTTSFGSSRCMVVLP